ncbi:MAG: Nif3-like dinuclear metal center hexameric protein [Tannerella sp.]|jgi:dinuclear metal center YbgI/SA1388 family protein|nr:Nif3-like dinuclear metal center hexameric protein [Tannerella sp.]
MPRIKDIIRAIEEAAPLPLQESYDNAGVQVGNINQKAAGALLCLDVTEEIIEEAADMECNLIVSHHPLIFKPIKSLTGKNYMERCIIKACKNNMVIYAAHTNLDNAFGGVNYKLAALLGLRNVHILSPQKNNLLKLVAFVPEASAETVRTALFNAGAGHIGNYDACSFNASGFGTFRASEACNPFCGEINKLHAENEIRIETILPAFLQMSITRALLSVHPYEEPAFDFYPLENSWKQAGSGVVGELPVEENELFFLQRMKDIFDVECVKHSPLTGKKIREVALCGGSGAFLIPEAIAYGADIFITGEAKYNDYLNVEDKILLATIGHYESEICTKEIFFDIISKKFPTFAIQISNTNLNPVKYL